MDSPAEAPARAPRSSDSGWGTKLALGAVVFILLVEFVLPGFVAAGISHCGIGLVFKKRSWITYDSFPGPPPPLSRTVLALLAAPNWLMQHSELMARFYLWEYFLARGKWIL